MNAKLGLYIYIKDTRFVKRLVCMWQFLKELELICLHTVEWFQVFLSNTNSFLCLNVYGNNHLRQIKFGLEGWIYLLQMGATICNEYLSNTEFYFRIVK